MNLTKAEKSRMRLFQIGKGNPGSIPQILDAIKHLADEALRDTLDVSKREAIQLLQKRINLLERHYESELKKILGSVDKIIEKKAKAERDLLFKDIKADSQFKGNTGPAPSTEFLLELIRPLIPNVTDGKTPTKEELAAIAKPLLLELMTQDLVINRVIAERDKETNDKVFGKVTDLIAAEISKIKRFGGGGSGDRVTAGSGISISFNNAGKKVITATGSAAVETPTGDVDGSNTSFTVTAVPNWIVADGISYYEGAGYSRSGFNITMDVAPSQYIRAMI